MVETRKALLAGLKAQIALIESNSRSSGLCDGDVQEALRERGCDCKSSHYDTSLDRDAANHAHSNPKKPLSENRKPSLAGEGDKAFAKLGTLVSRKEYSSEGMRRRLARAGFDAEIVDEAVRRAVRCSLIDDRRYADVLVRSRYSQGRGMLGIARELKSDGIDPYSVPLYIEMLEDANKGGDRELDRALELLRRNPPRSKNPRAAVYRRLTSKGFNCSVASSASRIWVDSCEDDLE